jgi:formylglycine-generating enzyme required for sulfatase activity
MMDFFISYTSVDEAWATWIAWQLEEVGFTTAIQAWDFRPGSNFVQDMQQAIEDTERTIAVLSSHYLSSRFTKAEWMAAFAKDPAGQQGLLLPIRVDECNPKGLLPQIVYINLVGLNEMDAKTTLLKGVSRRRDKPTQTPPFPGSAKGAQGQSPPFPGSHLRPKESRGRGNGCQFLTPNSNQVDTATDTQDIELTIEGNFEEYSEEDQARLMRAIGEFLKINGPIIIKKKRRGSIKITLELSPEQAEELLWAAKRGEFEDYGVVDAELKEAEETQSEVLGELALLSLAVKTGFKTGTNSIGMEFVLIPAGTFIMGSPDSDPDAHDREKPPHQVTLSQDFYLGKYPVTQAQWEAVMGTNPSRFFKGADRPVGQVSWDDVQAFMQKLNEREGVDHYRLPTEAEWEYACRAGSGTRYHFGDDAARLSDYAWYRANSEGQTHPVGQKQPNAWGLYDMHGNVWEWVQDWYGAYTANPVTNPIGPTSGADHVIRGGCWSHPARHARSAFRSRPLPALPGGRHDDFGFRCLSSGCELRSGA